MPSYLSEENQKVINRMARDPYYWVHENVPEAKQWATELFDLIDLLKIVWEESSSARIDLCFQLRWSIDRPVSALNIRNVPELQRKQRSNNRSLIYEINLSGDVLDEIDIRREIEPTCIMTLSHLEKTTMFWLGPDEMKVFFSGVSWDSRNSGEVLRDIKSKKRTRLLSMKDYRKVLDTHYMQCLRGQAGEAQYWFEGRHNEVLVNKPERVFQKSLYNFLRKEVEGDPSREHTFRDGSRCDIRVLTPEGDLYYIEIKWVGYCAKKIYGKAIHSAEDPVEVGVANAIAGAYQTKIYIEENNSRGYEQRITLGIFLLYDAYPNPVSPVDYGEEIEEYALLEVIEFRLVTNPPSVRAKNITKGNTLSGSKVAKSSKGRSVKSTDPKGKRQR